MLNLSTICTACERPLSGGRDTFGTMETPLCLTCLLDLDSCRQKAVEKVERDITRYRDELARVGWEIEELEGQRSSLETDIELAEERLVVLRGNQMPLPLAKQEATP